MAIERGLSSLYPVAQPEGCASESKGSIQKTIKTLPTGPGCYLFKDESGKIIYIGKAKDIKKRVSSYFNKRDQDEKTRHLIEHIKSVDFIVTDTEVEALVLENNLVKKNQPKYNIDLKDSKSFAYIELTEEKFPRLLLARGRPKGKGTFFGPFTSGEDRDHIITALRKAFKIRTCKRLPKRVCLRYHMGACEAPCIGEVTDEHYNMGIHEAKQVLSGKTKELSLELTAQMKKASLNKDYELALEYKKRADAVQWLSDRQKMQRDKKYDESIINYLIRKNTVYLIIFGVHKGVLDDKTEYSFPYTPDFLEEFIVQYYSENPVPREIILPVKTNPALEEFLRNKRKGAVTISVPKKGEKKQLLSLVLKNVDLTFFSEEKKLEDLQERIGLENLPKVIECFDISHLSGTLTVGSMVQFRNSKPDKSNYRRFKIQTVKGINDTRSISEVVRRRYYRLVKEHLPMPDLIVIDGGQGQLNAALSALKKLNLNIPVISIAKQFEEIYIPGAPEPLRLDKKTAALRLIQQIRDEAHRFAINYNRLLRKKQIRDE